MLRGSKVFANFETEFRLLSKCPGMVCFCPFPSFFFIVAKVVLLKCKITLCHWLQLCKGFALVNLGYMNPHVIPAACPYSYSLCFLVFLSCTRSFSSVRFVPSCSRNCNIFLLQSSLSLVGLSLSFRSQIKEVFHSYHIKLA